VYNTAGGSGALQLSDFNLSFSQNGGIATGVNMTSITKTNDNPLSGGETAVRIHFSVVGQPTGIETIEITPVDGSSIFDIVGNAMGGSQTTGTLALHPYTSALAPGKTIIRNNIVNPKTGTHTTINFRLTKAEKVNVTLYDLGGKPVIVLYNRTGNVGLNEVTWDGKNRDGKIVVPGVYYVVVVIGKERYAHKVLVVR
jgi:flagellar hook assembly protein FlgD